jgi:hypothetical protein
MGFPIGPGLSGRESFGLAFSMSYLRKKGPEESPHPRLSDPQQKHRYGLYSSRTRSTPWAGHRAAWKRCPHLLRLSPLSKAPPESKDHSKRAESIEFGRASST